MTAIYAHRGNVGWLGSTLAADDVVSRAEVPIAHGRPDGAPGVGPEPEEVAVRENARENTLEAFGAARRAGADGVEMDVRLSADGVPVIHHDRRLPDGRDLANIERGSLPDSVPTLEQALALLAGLSVNVEVKHENGNRRTAVVVAETLGRLGRFSHVLVSSFDEESLVAVRQVEPTVPLGLLIDWTRDPEAGLARAGALGCATLHPFVTQVNAALEAAARTSGLGLHVWTVNANADIRAMADLGVAAIITDRVAAAVPIVRGAGRPA